MSIAPRIVIDVSYVTRINDASHFSWQAQLLVILECHFSWQAQFGEIWVDSRSTKRCNFQYKMLCRGGKSKLCERMGSVLLGSCLGHARIGRAL